MSGGSGGGNPFAEDGDGDRTVIRPSAASAPPPPPPQRRNPFAEPEDDGDRTIIRPMPGGGRAAASRPARPVAEPPPPLPSAAPLPAVAAPARPAKPPQLPPRPAAVAATDLASAATDGAAGTADLAGLASAHADPLLAAATPLLLLLARLRNAASPPDPGNMRTRTLREVRAFERRARDAGVPMELLRPAHYALCASLDDAVLNTPWGRAAGWGEATLTEALHQEAANAARGGGGSGAGAAFFDLLARLRQDAAANLSALQVMYLCLSLGFMGPYRGTPGGQQRVDAIREETYAAIKDELRRRYGAGDGPTRDGTAPSAAAALSPHWTGVAAPYRPTRKGVPVWVAGSVALAAVAGVFAWSLIGLNARSDELHARMLAAPPAAMPRLVRAPLVQPPPPPPPAPEPSLADRLRAALQADVDGNRIAAILDTPSAAIVRVGTKGLFPQGSATLQPGAAPLLERIARALKEETAATGDKDGSAPAAASPAVPGPIRVLGYTDNQPTRTVRFPSNFQLSAAQAAAARTALARTLGNMPAGSRPTSEGRADADPVAPNTSPEGREQNRRIDIVVPRQPAAPAS